MAFTAQELQGGSSYSSCTLIGNWLESRYRRDELRSAFKERRAAGSLSYKKTQHRVAAALRQQQATRFCCKKPAGNPEAAAATTAAAAATAAAEATEETVGGTSSYYLKSGDILGLYSSASPLLLAALPLTACSPLRISSAAAAAKADAAAVAAKPSTSVWRNTFVIEALKGEPDGYLHYGQPVRLSTTEAGEHSEKRFLCCTGLSPNEIGSPRYVFWGEASPHSTWTIEAAAKGIRYEMEGDRVHVRLPFVLRHQTSGRCLSLSTSSEPLQGDFGSELTILAADAVPPSLPLLCESFAAGKWTPDEPVKQQGSSSVWMWADAGFFAALEE